MNNDTQKQLDEFHDACVALFVEIAKSLKLFEICDWLTKKLNNLK